MRLRFALVAAPLLAALACADAPSPTSTASLTDLEASLQTTSTNACYPSVAVTAINSVYPASRRGATIQRFNQARARAVQQGVEAAWPDFLALAVDVITREAAGTLLDPRGPLTAADGATLLVDQLYICGGRAPVGEVLGPAIKNGVDVAIGRVGPNIPTQLVVPSANFGVAEDGGFFDEPALLVIERVPDDPPFVPQEYTEYPPRYRAHVLPATAQANYGRTPVPGDPTILVIICPSDPHPGLDALTLLRIPDTYPAEPAQLIDAQHVHGYGVTCTQAGEYPAPQVGAASFGGRVFGALRRGASTAFGWLAPEPLYAVDGGIGGRTFFMSSFVAVARPAGGTQPGDVVVLNDVNLVDDYGLQNAGNRRLARNLVSLPGDGPRASATRVVFDRGRDAPCFVVFREACQDDKQTRITAELTGLGLSITKHDDVRSYAEVPADVKAIFFYNPRVAFTAADVAGLRTFVQEGGRIVLLGEHEGFYGPTGLQVQNDLLAGLGSAMRAVAARIDCAQVALPASSIQPHQTTEGVASLNVACMGAVEPAEGDALTLRSVDGTRIVGGVTRLGPAAVAAARAAAPQPSWSRAKAAPAPAPKVDSRGMPIGTR